MLCLALFFLVFLHMFFSPCMVLHKTMQHGSTCFFYSAKEHSNVLFIQELFYVLQQPNVFKILPGIEHATDHWHRSKHWEKRAFFSISITFTVKKSNPVAEPHRSPQVCSVRPRKGTEQCSMGVFSILQSELVFCVLYIYFTFKPLL